MHFNGRVSLLGVEERELRIKGFNAYPHSSKHYVKRVLINPGSKYRIKVIHPVLEVCFWQLCVENLEGIATATFSDTQPHTNAQQTWGYVLAGDRHTAELIQNLQVNSERVIPTSVRFDECEIWGFFLLSNASSSI